MIPWGWRSLGRLRPVAAGYAGWRAAAAARASGSHLDTHFCERPKSYDAQARQGESEKQSASSIHIWAGPRPGRRQQRVDGLENDVEQGALHSPGVLVVERGKGPRRMRAWARASILFSAGCLLSVAIHLLHLEHHVLTQDAGERLSLLDTPWWVPILCGVSSVLIGELFPTVDHIIGERPKVGWPSVVRGNIGFLGIAYASAKFSFDNKLEMAGALWIGAICLWWLTDQTRAGLCMSVLLASFGTMTVQLLSYHGVYRHNNPDFFQVRSWIPALLLAAVIAFASLGRQLART